VKEADPTPTPQSALAPSTPTPSISLHIKKQQWRAMHQAFFQEMQETLLAAKAAGDDQLVNEVFYPSSLLSLLSCSLLFSSSHDS
jgi:hypothetical protein